MKYCEDLLQKWDKRIQFEATLLFFFSVVSGSSFVSFEMFWHVNLVLNFLPLLYVITMFNWWYLCKRLIFNTQEKNQEMLIANIIAFILWLIISASVSLGTWDEWGWINKDVDVPAADNFYRAMNCALVAYYICTLTYDYYMRIESRLLRIKLWTLFLFTHAVVTFAYFVEWVIDAHTSGNYESIGARWFSATGSGLLILWCLPVFCQKKISKIQLVLLFMAMILYWWGSASLDCEFYADTADMTVMVGYQMLWTIILLIILESLPTMSTEIYVLGTELLIDQELDNDGQPVIGTTMNREMINLEDVAMRQKVDPTPIKPSDQL